MDGGGASKRGRVIRAQPVGGVSGSGEKRDESPSFQAQPSENAQKGLSLAQDILPHLSPVNRLEMIKLVEQLRSKQMSLPDFLNQSRILIGEVMYPVLLHGMGIKGPIPGTGGIRVTQDGRPPFPAFNNFHGNSRPSENLVELNRGSVTTTEGPRIGITPMSDSAMGARNFVNNQVSAGSTEKSSKIDDEDQKMDATALQDVMQYAGVDLKAEAEMVLRPQLPATRTPYHQARDVRIDCGFYCNPIRLKSLITAAVVPKGIREMGEDTLTLIALAVTRRIATLFERASSASKHRVAMHRGRFKIKIENDSRRQISLVDRFWTLQESKSTSLVNSQSFTSMSSLSFPNTNAISSGGPGSQIHSASHVDPRNMIRKGMVGGGKGGEDVAVKTKIANVTAAAAAGLTMKSWMTEAATMEASVSSSGTVSKFSNRDAGSQDGQSSSGMTLSQAPSMTPVSDRELSVQFASRTVSVGDLLFVAETDPHLSRHSSLLTCLYNQLTES